MKTKKIDNKIDFGVGIVAGEYPGGKYVMNYTSRTSGGLDFHGYTIPLSKSIKTCYTKSGEEEMITFLKQKDFPKHIDYILKYLPVRAKKQFINELSAFITSSHNFNTTENFLRSWLHTAEIEANPRYKKTIEKSEKSIKEDKTEGLSWQQIKIATGIL